MPIADINWITKSGLKINHRRTEITIFLKTRKEFPAQQTITPQWQN